MLKKLLASAGFVLLLASSASACTPTKKNPCPVFTPQGDTVTRGTVKQPLRLTVTLCYPAYDWESQKQRPGQRPFYVSLVVAGERGVGRGIPRYQTYEDMADAKLIQVQCYKQHYQPGWVVMTVTQCREEGFYTFLTTRVLTAADNGATVYFDDRPDLRPAKYRVR